MQILKKSILLVVLGLSSLSAHSLWVNSFESFVHKPGHITVGIGWGHTMPIDDMPNSANGKVEVENFTITSPNGKTTKLQLPNAKIEEAKIKTDEFDVFNVDVALQKIALKKDSPKGVYTIKANSKAGFYTYYIDKKDRKRLKFTTKDKLKDVKKLIWSVKGQNFAKSYLTLGNKWEDQTPTNKGLEIIPKTDLSNLKVGDMVEFEVLFFGKPLNMTATNLEFIKAFSNTFGQGKGFYLFSLIKNGKAQFEVQTPGQWIVDCHHKEDVTKDGPLKELYGKVNHVFHSASLTFNVRK